MSSRQLLSFIPSCLVCGIIFGILLSYLLEGEPPRNIILLLIVFVCGMLNGIFFWFFDPTT